MQDEQMIEALHKKDWRYLTVRIKYDRKRHKDWVVEYAEKPPIVGIQAVLEAYGSGGWELVCLNPEGFSAHPAFGVWQIRPRVYRATFKQPVEH